MNPAGDPGRTVRADIHLDIRKIKDVRVELSVQSRISVLNHAPISVAPTSARISAWISVFWISECGFYCGYPWLHGLFDTDIRNFTDIQADIQAVIQADIRTDSSTRGVISAEIAESNCSDFC